MRLTFTPRDAERAERVALAADATAEQTLAVARRIATEARRRAPRDTTVYARSITAEQRTDAQGPYAVASAGSRRAFYAFLIEWGGGRTQPQAVMRRSAAMVAGAAFRAGGGRR